MNNNVFKRAYVLVFNVVKRNYTNYGKDYVKAQLLNNGEESKYYKWFENSNAGSELIKKDYYSAWQGVGCAIDDIINQIWVENRAPEQVAFDNPIQIREINLNSK